MDYKGNINPIAIPDDFKDITAESMVISTVICKPEYIYLDEGLSHKHFSDDFNSLMYWALKNLIRREKSITPLTLKYQIESLPEGKGVLSSLKDDILDEIIDKASIIQKGTKEDYLDMSSRVKILSERRRIIDVVDQYQHLVENKDISNRELVNKVSTELEEIHNGYIDANDVYLYTKDVRNIWEEIVDMRNDDGSFGLPTKHKRLNDYIAYVGGRLVLLSARARILAHYVATYS